MSVQFTIDGHTVEVAPGQTVLDGARKLGIEIPTLCYLEKCGPLTSCLVCLVKINGKLVPSCGTKAEPGMRVESEINEVHEARKTALELLFSDHVGDCLSPCNRLCPLRMDIPVMIRQIQAGQLTDAAHTIREALPLPSVLGRLCHHPCEQGCRRATWDQSAGIREMERFVADWDLLKSPSPAELRPPSTTGKSVVVVGAGPAGLSAAYHLLLRGHACTITDRQARGGGSLRELDETLLPRAVVDAELKSLEKLGAVFRLGAALGRDISIDGLLRGFDAVVLTLGEISKTDGEALGLEMAPGGIKVNADTCQMGSRAVFAAGRCVKPLPQLVRAMAEGLAVAGCVDQFLRGHTPARMSKPFSSVMGRLEDSELEIFVRAASPAKAVSPCEACRGFTESEATAEAERCLHCDCRSSGNCALQAYAQEYGADASRFRQQRKPFEQFPQPGGVIFEPGKCILCGICVKLTEMAREPLGLTFIGRGFDVRVAVPFDHAIQEGLQKVAAECVEHCPTGALEFADAVASAC